jgi:glucans biosynthesis protein
MQRRDFLRAFAALTVAGLPLPNLCAAGHALWAHDRRRFQVKFFHLGLYYTNPVRMHEVVNGQVQELAYDLAMFYYGKSGLENTRLSQELGFAGFHVHFHTDLDRDLVAFLGASYFCAVGGEMQYGLSACGLAIDCGMDRAEEFSMFTAFWLERPAPDDGTRTVYALMDSPIDILSPSCFPKPAVPRPWR